MICRDTLKRFTLLWHARFYAAPFEDESRQLLSTSYRAQIALISSTPRRLSSYEPQRGPDTLRLPLHKYAAFENRRAFDDAKYEFMKKKDKDMTISLSASGHSPRLPAADAMTIRPRS